MFEKSLVDLIRGLRSHKGNEAEYIQAAIKECRGEIRSQDMDLKATALLKLIYLEMFGYDMSWAAFNVLEVMSSAKPMQKRVGYLAAVQTFRPDTDVLMLATNLLKKDLSSPSIPTMSLPLITLPHIITSSLALSILNDLLPRLSHSQPVVRKKTIVTLYRLALVYPETLRVAWPKIKERLMDEEENSSVTAATVNVVCELGWRRPQDFLSLAPRLFELLIEGGNNWMAIKIIKLFAVLTPLEPRLVKKLVKPLMNLIQTTTAMSLLYECVNGIIQGGILSGTDGDLEQDEVAKLCIKKLREMIVVDGDPNLKYVALLAFNKIATTYPVLVSLQEDVILNCLDDPDLSIRLQALELATGIISTENLQSVVNRLMKQLSREPKVAQADEDHEEEMTDMEQKLIPDKRSTELPTLPADYRRQVMGKILDMCSDNYYQNISDFEWYLDILLRLVGLLPPEDQDGHDSEQVAGPNLSASSVAGRIGQQLLDIAVRVKELRPDTTQAVEKLVLISNRDILFPAEGAGKGEVLKSAAWVVGEYPHFLNSPYETINSLIHESSSSLPHATVAVYVQAIPKVLAHISRDSAQNWAPARRMTFTLLLARIIDFLEKQSTHPNLEVQERSVEYLELLHLASDAISAQSAEEDSPPALITTAIPSLFHGGELNPVAPGAQHKVPLPLDINLDDPINIDLAKILNQSQIEGMEDINTDEYHTFYHEREKQPLAATLSAHKPTISYPEEPEEPLSYQSAPESPTTLTRRKAERTARSRDDPFYIPPSDDTATTMHDIMSHENGQSLDLDTIPIVSLQLEPTNGGIEQPKPKKKKPKTRKFNIASDETIESPTDPAHQAITTSTSTQRRPPNLLTVDSSNLLSSTSLLEDPPLSSQTRPLGGLSTLNNYDETADADADPEMAAAVREVERLRLVMQRDQERAQVTYSASGEGDAGEGEGVVIKRKAKKKNRERGGQQEQEVGGDAGTAAVEGEVVKKKKKKKKEKIAEEGVAGGEVVELTTGGQGGNHEEAFRAQGEE